MKIGICMPITVYGLKFKTKFSNWQIIVLVNILSISLYKFELINSNILFIYVTILHIVIADLVNICYICKDYEKNISFFEIYV